MVGGTCGSALVLAVPGALLLSYASQKAADSRRQLAWAPSAAGGLQQPLLGTAAVAVEAAEQGGALPPPLPQQLNWAQAPPPAGARTGAPASGTARVGAGRLGWQQPWARQPAG